MPTYSYRAITPSGTITEGQIEAGGRHDAFRQMEGRALRPISLTELAGGPNGAGFDGRMEGYGQRAELPGLAKHGANNNRQQ